jgi:hypothetical protein
MPCFRTEGPISLTTPTIACPDAVLNDALEFVPVDDEEIVEAFRFVVFEKEKRLEMYLR